MSEERLLPCPFCGKKVARISHFLGNFMVTCDVEEGGCKAGSGYHPTREQAIAAWNRRANNVGSNGEIIFTDKEVALKGCENHA